MLCLHDEVSYIDEWILIDTLNTKTYVEILYILKEKIHMYSVSIKNILTKIFEPKIYVSDEKL